uniref:Reverse transcriptase domain-containing protein n=1 Tax=Panagrellus redivivus TaxID=6233 RepID=A0A7E4UYQ2_PANRE
MRTLFNRSPKTEPIQKVQVSPFLSIQNSDLKFGFLGFKDNRNKCLCTNHAIGNKKCVGKKLSRKWHAFTIFYDIFTLWKEVMTTDYIQTIEKQMENCREWMLLFHMVFIDYIKAFNWQLRKAIWKALGGLAYTGNTETLKYITIYKSIVMKVENGKIPSTQAEEFSRVMRCSPLLLTLVGNGPKWS